MRFVTVILSVLMLASACGGDGGGTGGGGACITDTRIGDTGAGDRVCQEYSGASSCPAPGMAASSCVSTGRIGRCARSVNGQSVTQHYYTGQASTWMQGCTQTSGTWSAN